MTKFVCAFLLVLFGFADPALSGLAENLDCVEADQNFLAFPEPSAKTLIAQNWLGLSREERQAKLTKFMQARSARSQAQNAPSRNNSNGAYRLYPDLAYGQKSLEKLDLYAPNTSRNSCPILFFVHGGGWRNGDKAQKDHAEKGAIYAENGVVFVSVNYGLAPQVIHPQQIEEIAAAFAWIKAHAGEYGGDPKRIYVMGHSAGAHLVDLLATNDRFLKGQGLTLADIQGVISLDTASLNLLEQSKNGSFEGDLVGGMIDVAFGNNPKVLADASPLLAVQRGKRYPPFLMYCGTSRRACLLQHEQFATAIKAVGGQVSVVPVSLSHREINLQSSQPKSDIYRSILSMVTASEP